jgi:hypothetical protein
MRKPVG